MKLETSAALGAISLAALALGVAALVVVQVVTLAVLVPAGLRETEDGLTVEEPNAVHSTCKEPARM